MKKNRLLTIFTITFMLLSLAVLSYNVSARPLNAERPRLGDAGDFSVLGFSAVTNSGPTKLGGSIGVWSGTSITGLDEMTVGGEVHKADAVAKAAHDAAAAADGNLLSQAVTKNLGALDGLTLVPGVYDLGAGSLSGKLTLDGEGVYIFRTTSDLTSSGSIKFINGARACDVYWHVATQANLVGGSFAGTIIAGSGIVFGTGVSLDGRALALGGPVTLLSNNISGPNCPAAKETQTQSPVQQTATLAPGTTAQPTATLAPGTTAQPTNTPPAVGGLPGTGGAPFQTEVFPSNLFIILGGAFAIALFLGAKAYYNSFHTKR